MFAAQVPASARANCSTACEPPSLAANAPIASTLRPSADGGAISTPICRQLQPVFTTCSSIAGMGPGTRRACGPHRNPVIAGRLPPRSRAARCCPRRATPLLLRLRKQPEGASRSGPAGRRAPSPRCRRSSACPQLAGPAALHRADARLGLAGHLRTLHRCGASGAPEFERH